MPGHAVLEFIGSAIQHFKVVDKGDEQVVDLAGKSLGVLEILSSGTRLLPSQAPAGTIVVAINRSGGAVDIQDSSSASGVNVANNRAAVFIATGTTGATTSWNYFAGTAMGS